MADAVTSQTIQDGDRIAVMKFTNISDGSGEVDISGWAGRIIRERSSLTEVVEAVTAESPAESITTSIP